MYIQAQQVSGDRYLTERRPDDQRIACGPLSARVDGRKVQKYRSLTASSFATKKSANKSANKSAKKTGAKRAQGFTVIELVVAMAVAAVLASIALPRSTASLFNSASLRQRMASLVRLLMPEVSLHAAVPP